MTFWPPLWKYVFLFGAASFAILSLWVAVAGLGDIRRLLKKLGKKS